MFEYSTRAYGSQFSGEKNGLKIQNLVVEILSKNLVSFFWDTLYERSHGLYVGGAMAYMGGAMAYMVLKPTIVLALVKKPGLRPS